MKAIFLDRDGIINKEVNYCHKISDFHFIEDVFCSTKAMAELGYKIFIFTNQAGIARGYYSESDFLKLTDWMLGEFKKHGVDIAKVYYCPHHPDGVNKFAINCDCRKPLPGMLLQAKMEFGIDMCQSITVGDKITDALAGRAAGVGQNYLVQTGHRIDVFDDDLLIFSSLTQLVNKLANA